MKKKTREREGTPPRYVITARVIVDVVLANGSLNISEGRDIFITACLIIYKF